ncbi:hypothetical protein THAOC_35717, partial [Thalassiosira oceanica]
LAQSPGEPLHGPFLRPRYRRTTDELNDTTSEPDERRTIQKAPASTLTCTSDQAARSKPRDCLICKELLAYVRRTTVPYSLELHNIPGGTSTTINRKPPNHKLSCPGVATKGGALKDDNFPGIPKTLAVQLAGSPNIIRAGRAQRTRPRTSRRKSDMTSKGAKRTIVSSRPSPTTETREECIVMAVPLWPVGNGLGRREGGGAGSSRTGQAVLQVGGLGGLD